MSPRLPDWAQVTPERNAHIEAVAELVETWARATQAPSQERDRWLSAAYLHDALRDARPEYLAELAPDTWGKPALRHGPAAATLAEQDGETDAGILAAIRYHSVGYAGWDDAGRMLYMADYLEPGRSFHRSRREKLVERVPQDPSGVLLEVARERLGWGVSRSWPLIKETVDFWHSLLNVA